MSSRSSVVSCLVLSGALSASACGGTSEDSLFHRQSPAPSGENGVDAGSFAGSTALGAGGNTLGEVTGSGGTGGNEDGAGGRSAGGAALGAGGAARGAGGSTRATGGNGSETDAGPPCVTSRFYLDDDGDGFGDPRRFSEACDKPAGHVSNAEDCYDGNADTHPGQTALFSVDRGDGSYDYDCSGEGTPKETTVGKCGTFPFCTSSPGWKTASPACGVSATWLESCTGLTAICGQKTETRVQQCW